LGQMFGFGSGSGFNMGGTRRREKAYK